MALLTNDLIDETPYFIALLPCRRIKFKSEIKFDTAEERRLILIKFGKK
jgi:hypothetical protein